MSANPALLGSVSTGMGVEPEYLQAVSRGLGTATVPALLAEATATISENSGLDAAVVKSIKSRSIATTASCLLRADDLYAVVQESLRSLPTGMSILASRFAARLYGYGGNAYMINKEYACNFFLFTASSFLPSFPIFTDQRLWVRLGFCLALMCRI